MEILETNKFSKVDEKFDTERFAGLLLGSITPAPRDSKWMFVTISPPPGLLLKTAVVNRQTNKRKYMPVKYEKLRTETQLNVCMGILEKVYIPYLTQHVCIVIWELNKSGNVHLHCLIQDAFIQDDYALWMFRKSISSDFLTLRICGSKHKDYMNNIFFCDDVNERVGYMFKDENKRLNKSIWNYAHYSEF